MPLRCLGGSQTILRVAMDFLGDLGVCEAVGRARERLVGLTRDMAFECLSLLSHRVRRGGRKLRGSRERQATKMRGTTSLLYTCWQKVDCTGVELIRPEGEVASTKGSKFGMLYDRSQDRPCIHCLAWCRYAIWKAGSFPERGTGFWPQRLAPARRNKGPGERIRVRKYGASHNGALASLTKAYDEHEMSPLDALRCER